jgi:hypothetical protein
MKGMFKNGLILVGVAALMGFTNPKPESYNDYASGKLVSSAQKEICKKFSYCEKGTPPDFIKNTLLEPAINVATKRQNLLFFSIYTTDIPGVRSLKTIAAFGNFFTFQDK